MFLIFLFEINLFCVFRYLWYVDVEIIFKNKKIIIFIYFQVKNTLKIYFIPVINSTKEVGSKEKERMLKDITQILNSSLTGKRTRWITIHLIDTSKLVWFSNFQVLIHGPLACIRNHMFWGLWKKYSLTKCTNLGVNCIFKTWNKIRNLISPNLTKPEINIQFTFWTIFYILCFLFFKISFL